MTEKETNELLIELLPKVAKAKKEMEELTKQTNKLENQQKEEEEEFIRLEKQEKEKTNEFEKLKIEFDLLNTQKMNMQKDLEMIKQSL